MVSFDIPVLAVCIACGFFAILALVGGLGGRGKKENGDDDEGFGEIGG
ncbi:MAG: hypothetical protein V1820_02195 [archaeon]